MEEKKTTVLNQLKGGLIVSCQSEPPEPFARPSLILAMARAALMGGAVGIRANLPRNVRHLVNKLNVPIIALYKKKYARSDVFITPTIKELKALIKSGAPVIALDATQRERPGGERLEDLLHFARKHANCLLMADVSTVHEGVEAARLGFDLIGTTLAGYTAYTAHRFDPQEPDFNLLKELVTEVGDQRPVIAEGRIWQPEQAKKCLDLGAFAVVVGTAITRPWVLTARFVQALRR
ncbi:N-acetylmannosamine-6-phosphate 2-epimerase [Calditrichota bacterium LG25]